VENIVDDRRLAIRDSRFAMHRLARAADSIDSLAILSVDSLFVRNVSAFYTHSWLIN